ncbi:hypothetical protein [Hydrogenophaga sp. PAMC20947]|uniref:hypothetical protein n=1 Tax=Hydrogenophaga sp. PAMC20947 TaxID=2565558 RepID=UPI001B352A68|nr:hypothetical protein [Hydrogenophaga sp. PAMC20947]
MIKQWSSAVVVCLPLLASAHDAEQAPQRWSSFKDPNKSVAACKIQSRLILEQLGLARRADNENGICGVFKGIRVVVKCTGNGPHSELWVALAGADRDSVELIRNKIRSDIQYPVSGWPDCGFCSGPTRHPAVRCTFHACVSGLPCC